MATGRRSGLLAGSLRLLLAWTVLILMPLQSFSQSGPIPCATDADCPAGAVCDGGECWGYCGDGDCTFGETAGSCAADCLSDVGCTEDVECEALDYPQCANVACFDVTHTCALVPIEGCVCQPDCLGKQCGWDGCGGDCGLCQGGQTCGPADTCVAASCTEAWQCMPGQVCQGGACSWVCGNNVCNPGETSVTCPADCPAGTSCTSHAECAPDGDPCTADECVNNVCQHTRIPGCGCAPACANRQCGPDGCGGSCGWCLAGQVCNGSFHCGPCTPSCLGRQCGTDGCLGNCGTCPAGVACTLAGQCEGSCTPACAGKQCGPNGCGAWCGTCASGHTCDLLGQCVACTPSCGERECGPDGCGGFCGQCAASETCDASGVCWSVSCTGTEDCLAGQLCQDGSCAYVCGNDRCDPGESTFSCETDCHGGLPCTLDSQCEGDGNPCTEERCNTQAGVCQSVTIPGCVCTPACTGKQCGPDLCGGSCGACPAGQYCDLDFHCVPGCQADCQGKDCGPDGCGGFCGVCAAGGFCELDGTCTGGGCSANCAGKQCGPNGCGGVCGTCAPGQACDGGGLCTGACSPICVGKACGPDGCGGSCGTCAAGWSCNAAGQCVSGPCSESVQCYSGQVCQAGVCVYACGNLVCDPGETSGNCPLDCPGGTECEEDAQCDPDGNLCTAESCSDQTGLCQSTPIEGCSCDPQCVGRECGPDGCGGSCGGCAPGQSCGLGGQCVGDCVPSCAGKQCGANGCGGSCGTCAGGEVCTTGFQCVACVPDCLGKECGPDLCGGSCGSCPAGLPCESDGSCGHGLVLCGCVLRECGPDGCGLDCGQCGAGQECDGGRCVSSACAYDWDCEAWEYCLAGECVSICGNGRCDPGEATASCPMDCPGGTTCHTDLECPDDGNPCTHSTCSQQDLLCHATPIEGCTCTPDCAQRQCGADLCGGTCGACPTGQWCNGGLCWHTQCLVDAECPYGEVCDLGYCRWTTCANDANCRDGQVCQGGQCGYLCGNGVCERGEDLRWCPSDCPTALGCTHDADCPDDLRPQTIEVCQDGVCTWLLDDSTQSCPPACLGGTQQCGLDPCGRFCGACPGALTCTPWGTCMCLNDQQCGPGRTCEAGVCDSPCLSCDDGNPCTTDECDVFLGDCVHVPVHDCIPYQRCGDGTCGGPEERDSCPADCPEQCQDHSDCSGTPSTACPGSWNCVSGTCAWTCIAAYGWCNTAADCEIQEIPNLPCNQGTFTCSRSQCGYECDAAVVLHAGDASLSIPAGENTLGVTFVERPYLINDIRFIQASHVYECGPRGRTFSSPLTITLPYNTATVTSIAAVAIVDIESSGIPAGLAEPVSPGAGTVELYIDALSTFVAAVPVSDCDVSNICAAKARLDSIGIVVPGEAVEACESLKSGDVANAMLKASEFYRKISLLTGADSLCSLSASMFALPQIADKLTGVWVGDLSIQGECRKHTFVIKQREDGGLLGYVAGGTAWRMITGGFAIGDNASIAFKMSEERGLTRSIVLAGSVSGDDYTGTATVTAWNTATGEEVDIQAGFCTCAGGAAPCVDGFVSKEFGFAFRRVDYTNMVERQYLAYTPSAGANFNRSAQISLVVNESNDELISGGFVSIGECGFPQDPSPVLAPCIPSGDGTCTYDESRIGFPFFASDTLPYACGGSVEDYAVTSEGLYLRLGTSGGHGRGPCDVYLAKTSVDMCGGLDAYISPEGGSGFTCYIDGMIETGTMQLLDLGSVYLADVNAVLVAFDELVGSVDASIAGNPDGFPSVADNYSHSDRILYARCTSACSPNCAGRRCGPDGCGGSCGSCGGSLHCSPVGICAEPPSDACGGRLCGPDGWGGSCGECNAGEYCLPSGTCSDVCERDCSDRDCGPDGCGGTCGTCSGTCSTSGVISKADLIEYLLDRPYAAEMKLQPNSFRSIMGLSEELLETRCGGSGGILPSISFRDTRSYRASSSGSWTVFKDSDAFPPDDELIVIKKEETSGTFKFIGNQIKFWAGGSLPLARLNRSPVQYSSMGVHSYQVHNGTVDITVENKTRPFGAHWENHLGLDFVVGQAFGAELEVFAPVAGRIVYVNDGGPGSDCGVSIAVGPYTLTYYSLDHDGLLNSAVYLNVAVVNGGLVNAGDRIGSMMVIPGLPRRILHWGVSTGLLRDTCPYHWLENAGRKQVEAMANWDTGVGVVEPYVCNPNRPLEYFGSPACPLRTVWQNECLASASAGSDERPWRLETEKGLSEGRCLYLSNGAVAADDVCINAAAGLPGEQVVFTSDEYRYKWCIGDGACSGGLLELLTNGEGISNRGTVLFQFDSGQGQQPITKERLVRLKWSGGHASEMVLCREVVLDGCGAELPVACMADETCVCDIYTPAIADPCVAR